jgi:hypothetical protein
MIKLFVVVAILSPCALLFASQPGGKEVSVQFPVFLNHFYLTLDHTTYSAIESSKFLRREFAASEQRTTVRKDRTYTGLYFYGTNTYFEFFDADRETGRREGDSAIAFGVEAPGASRQLAEALGTSPITITRQLEHADIPWFFQTMPKGLSLESGISTWVMEYHPQFLLEWHSEAGGVGSIARKAVLQRYRAVLTGVPAQPYLSDVVAITMATDIQVTRQMTELGKVFGYGVRIDGSRTVLQGPDFELRLVPATESIHGVRQVALRVTGTVPKDRELHFGSTSVLVFHPEGRATWSF